MSAEHPGCWQERYLKRFFELGYLDRMRLRNPHVRDHYLARKWEQGNRCRWTYRIQTRRLEALVAR